MYILNDDTGVTVGAKNNLFKNIFPQYEQSLEKNKMLQKFKRCKYC